MATANVTWTNNSQSANPAANNQEIDRSVQLAFNHANAAPSQEASGNTGGLNPLAATGSYSDTSAPVDSHVAYRVTTSRGSGGTYEEVESMASGHEYIYDIATDLAYPNGDPPVATNFNCSVEPMFHMDTARIPNWDFSAGTERVTSGLPSIIRHDKTGSGWTIYVSSATTAHIASESNDSGTVRRVLEKETGNGGGLYAKIPTGGAPVFCPDGVTAFRACKAFEASYVDQGIGGASGNGTSNPTYGFPTTAQMAAGYNSSLYFTLANTNCYMLGSAGVMGCGGSFGITNQSFFASVPSWMIYCYRLNNDLASFNAGTIKPQMFRNGSADIATGGNKTTSSYHGYPTLGGAAYRGAAGWAANSVVNLQYAGGTKRSQFGEWIVFNEALDATDMNAVFGYLCNKYGETLSPVNTGQLIN